MQHKNILEIIDSADVISIDGGPLLSSWFVSYEEDSAVFEWGEDNEDYKVVLDGDVLRDPDQTFIDENIIKTTDADGYRTIIKLHILTPLDIHSQLEH